MDERDPVPDQAPPWSAAAPWRGLLGALAAISLLVGPLRAQQPPAGTGGRLSKQVGRQIEVLGPEFPSAEWRGARNRVRTRKVTPSQGRLRPASRSNAPESRCGRHRHRDRRRLDRRGQAGER